MTVNGPMRLCAAGMAALMLAQGCGRSEDGDQAATAGGDSVQCVNIPEGYYLFVDGKFAPASTEQAQAVAPAVNQRKVAWVHEYEERLASTEGYDWLNVDAIGPVVILSGLAPDEVARTRAGEAVGTQLAADPALAGRDFYLVNGISTEAGETTAGARLASFMPEPTREACQVKATQIMRGRSVSYTNDDRSVDETSHALLDAVAGLAMICSDYRMEIGVHTDARGAESYNRDLSLRRAEAISDYIAGQGIDRASLEPVGYGESQPILTEQTSEAYALNSRVELYFLRAGAGE